MAFILSILFVLVCQPASALRAGSGTRKTPVGKVAALLERLANQAADEGAKEAAQYDKYACFCKDQARTKTESIEKSEEQIESLTATITELEAQIGVLNQDVITLGKRIDAVETEVKTEKADRKTEREKWEVDDKDMADAIAATRGAVTALSDSKKRMNGAKLNGGEFLQIQDARQAIDALLSLASVQASASPANVQDLTALVQATFPGNDMPEDPGKAAKYQYQSNEILELLGGLLVDFKKNKADLWETEFAARKASDTKVLDLENEKKFKQESKDKKEAISAAKDEDKADAEKEKTAETDAKTADEEFKKELTTQCGKKATDWDERSTIRANEIAMMHEASVLLKTAVDPTYAANSKLVGLAKVSSHVSKSVSFLQQHQQNSGGAAQVVHKAVQLLDQEAKELKSPMLSALASKVALNKDHFVKVRSIINDLIKSMEEMAIAEATQKSFCDGKMKAAVTDRDTEQLNKEAATATISAKEAEKQELLDEIATLSQEISDLAQALNEQTELRSAEKLVNDKAITDATAGQAAIASAMEVLQGFYKKHEGAFAQVKPPSSDRDDNTVGDLAPKTWEGKYKGNQDASKGIIGLLNVINSDYERTVATVTQNEAFCVKEFDQFKKDTEGSIKTKDTEKTTKSDKVDTTETDILTAKDSKKDASDMHAKALEELEKLSAMCVDGEETYEERVAARQKEIEALRQAMQILDAYKQ